MFLCDTDIRTYNTEQGRDGAHIFNMWSLGYRKRCSIWACLLKNLSCLVVTMWQQAHGGSEDGQRGRQGTLERAVGPGRSSRNEDLAIEVEVKAVTTSLPTTRTQPQRSLVRTNQITLQDWKKLTNFKYPFVPAHLRKLSLCRKDRLRSGPHSKGSS